MRLTGRDLACARGDRPVFSGVSFAAEPGEGLVLNGPNGAGKSTLLRLIAGLLRPIAGEIRLDGGAPDTPIGQHCHYVGHLDALKATMTAEENVRFWAAYLGGGDAPAALDAVGLGHLADIPAGLLSAGQKRRLSLARLAAAPRPIWLLDEPTVSLDAAARGDLERMMDGHLAGGGLLVVATHQALGLERQATLTLAGPGG